MLNFFIPVPPPPCPSLFKFGQPPLPLGHPACFKNVCNFRFVTIIISLILLKNTFGNFFYIININETIINKIFKRQSIPYNVPMIQNFFLLLISFYSTKTNMFFVLVFFLTRTSRLLNKTPPPYVRVCPDF